MNTSEKTAKLLTLFGVRFVFEPETAATEQHYSVYKEDVFIGVAKTSDLYDSSSMALAWWILNWALNDDRLNDYDPDYDDHKVNLIVIQGAVVDGYISPIWRASPEEAQRTWLDKILELAIEAGMVNIENDKGQTK